MSTKAIGVDRAPVAAGRGTARARRRSTACRCDRGGARGKIIEELFEATAEARRSSRPTFVTGHPVEISPLARVDRNDPLAHRAVRAVRRRARAGQRLLRAQRPGRAAAAVRGRAGGQGRRRRRGAAPSTRTTSARSSTACRPPAASASAWTAWPCSSPASTRSRKSSCSPPCAPNECLKDLTMTRTAWGAGLATIAADGSVLDTWFRWLGLGRVRRRRLVRPTTIDVAARAARHGRRDASRDDPPGPADDRRRRAHRSRRPTPTCGCTCCRTGSPHRGRSTWTARSARSNNVAWTNLGPVAVADIDDVRLRVKLAGGVLHGARPRQVPADDRLRHPDGRPHRRRRSRAPRRPPRRGHHRDARGVLQLQRRHARRVDGRGPHLGRRRRRRRQRHRRRRLDPWARCRAAATEQITIGERCLLGANAGIGISLGDDCVVEAGLYVTAGTPVLTPAGRGEGQASCRAATT